MSSLDTVFKVPLSRGGLLLLVSIGTKQSSESIGEAATQDQHEQA